MKAKLRSKHSLGSAPRAGKGPPPGWSTASNKQQGVGIATNEQTTDRHHMPVHPDRWQHMQPPAIGSVDSPLTRAAPFRPTHPHAPASHSTQQTHLKSAGYLQNHNSHGARKDLERSEFGGFFKLSFLSDPWAHLLSPQDVLEREAQLVEMEQRKAEETKKCLHVVAQKREERWRQDLHVQHAKNHTPLSFLPRPLNSVDPLTRPDEYGEVQGGNEGDIENACPGGDLKGLFGTSQVGQDHEYDEFGDLIKKKKKKNRRLKEEMDHLPPPKRAIKPSLDVDLLPFVHES